MSEELWANDEELWAAVDEYLAERLIPADAALTAAREANAEAKLPAIDVSATQGRFLYLLAKIQGARRILEVGTLGGYSTIWLARALPARHYSPALSYPRRCAIAGQSA